MSVLPGRRETAVGFDGTVLASTVFGDEEAPTTLLLVHATGFCKETWAPVVNRIAALGFEYRGVAMDQRGHGDSSPPASDRTWSAIGRDVLTVVGDGAGAWIGVGHSGGASALVMAETARPGTFSGLVLIEPIISSPGHRFASESMVDVALKRKRFFGSRREARRNFAGRDPFAGWEPDALDAYIDGGFRSEGDRVVLKCLPEVEAEFFRQGNAEDTWDQLGEIDIPVALVVGRSSGTHPPEFVRELAGRFQDVETVTLSGATHFVPMERPADIATAVVGIERRVRR